MSQAVTLVESVKPEHQAIAQEVIEKCLPYSGNSMRIGISGVPGAGKSTSIDVFGLHVLEKGGKLAVLAIDPSSERSKGSILGDKTRMEKLSVHPKSFIRPSPSAGSLGGVARKTRETIILCEVGGLLIRFFVETVWSRAERNSSAFMVDFFLLIQLAGTGDEFAGDLREVSWKWRTVLLSIKRMETISIRRISPPLSSGTPCIFSHLRNQVGSRSIDLFRLLQHRYQGNMGYGRRVYGVHRKRMATSTINVTSKLNTGCTKASTTRCGISSTITRR